MMIGYLSPEARFYECESWGHVSKANEIYEEIYGEHCYGSAENQLLQLGYLVLRARDAYMNYRTDDGKWIVLADRQIDWIQNHLEALNDAVKHDLGEILCDQEKMKKRHTAQ
jgi:hypothetical protein